MTQVLTLTQQFNYPAPASDVNPLPAPPWMPANTLKAQSGVIVPVSIFGSYATYDATAAPNDAYLEAVVPSINFAGGEYFYLGLGIRASADLADGYFLEVSGIHDEYYEALVDYPAGDFLYLNQHLHSFTPGTSWGVAAVGSTIYFLKNGAPITSVVDATHTSGTWGAFLESSLFPNIQLSSIFGGAASLVTVPDPTLQALAVEIGTPTKLTPTPLTSASDVIFTVLRRGLAGDFSGVLQVVGTVTTLTSSLQVSMDGGLTWSEAVAAASFLSNTATAKMVTPLIVGALYRIHPTVLTGSQDFWICVN